MGGLYERFFDRLVSTVTELDLVGLKWGAEQARGLAIVLGSFSKLQSLKCVPSRALALPTSVSAAADRTRCMCIAPVYRSVGFNNITGDGAEQLARVVLGHSTLVDFCSIPLASLRSNRCTGLDIEKKAMGEPGAIVLAALLPSAPDLTSLKCAACMRPRPRSPVFCR